MVGHVILHVAFKKHLRKCIVKAGSQKVEALVKEELNFIAPTLDVCRSVI